MKLLPYGESHQALTDAALTRTDAFKVGFPDVLVSSAWSAARHRLSPPLFDTQPNQPSSSPVLCESLPLPLDRSAHDHPDQDTDSATPDRQHRNLLDRQKQLDVLCTDTGFRTISRVRMTPQKPEGRTVPGSRPWSAGQAALRAEPGHQ